MIPRDSTHAAKFPADMASYFVSSWNKREIWSLDLPVATLPLASLSWHLDHPFWSTRPPEPLFDLAPRTVLAQSGTHPRHDERIRTADTGYPIDLGMFGSTWVILDGIHRLAKLASQGAIDVEVRYVPNRYTSSGDDPTLLLAAVQRSR